RKGRSVNSPCRGRSHTISPSGSPLNTCCCWPSPRRAASKESRSSSSCCRRKPTWTRSGGPGQFDTHTPSANRGVCRDNSSQAMVGRSSHVPASRVRRCCCQHPLPSELHGRHFDACSSSIRQRSLPERGCPIGLGVNLSVTATGPATELTSVAQAAPAEVIATSPTVLLCLLRRLADGSRPPTPGGSRPAFAWSDVASGSTPIRPLTGRHSLPPPSFTRSPIDAPCGGSTLAGGLRAYHVASREPSWVRSRLGTGGSSSAPGEFGAPGPGHVPFGPSLSAPLACSWSRRLR